jgi:putative addiction module killer protein
MDYTILQTETFADWLLSLRDAKAKAAAIRRIERAEAGNLGDIKSVGNGISEMRVDVGAGYRMYFTIRNRTVLFLLAGGNKSTQSADIRDALALAKEI